MWPNPQKTAALDTFVEKSVTKNFIFCAVSFSIIWMSKEFKGIRKIGFNVLNVGKKALKLKIFYRPIFYIFLYYIILYFYCSETSIG